MIIFDSNIWIALQNADDTLYTKAHKLAEQVKGPITVPEYIAVEVSTILTKRVSKQAADAFLQSLEQGENIVLLPSGFHFFSAASLFYRSHNHRSLSFIDTSLFFLSKLHTVHTFDKKLANAIKKRKQ